MDKLGCYKVGDLKFYSKLEAIEMMQRTGVQLHWDFNEAAFSSYDWTVEPQDNLLDLYRQRAQQLRDKYDYIILMYSSGYDSQQILEAFLDNDIKLDEVCSWINYKGNGDKNSYLNKEVYDTAVPRIQQYQSQFPYLKHRLLDLTDFVIQNFSQVESYDWIYNTNMFMGPGVISRQSMPLKVKEWADIISSGKKLCVLWGKDKPRVHHIDGKFAVRFLDLVDDAASVKSIAGQEPYTDELFYWTPDLPKLIIKQAHIIKNYLNSYDIEQVQHVGKFATGLSYKIVNGETYWLNIEGTAKLVYPEGVIESGLTEKPPSIVISSRDEWFYKLNNTDIMMKNLSMGMNKLVDSIPDYWKNDPNDFTKGIKGCWSKAYFIE